MDYVTNNANVPVSFVLTALDTLSQRKTVIFETTVYRLQTSLALAYFIMYQNVYIHIILT